MFALAQSELFKSTVKINVRTKSNSWREESLIITFERKGEEDRERLNGMKNIELLREVMKDWEGVTVSETDKTLVPFNEENFETFLKMSGAVREAVTQYMLDNFNIKDAQKKI